MIPTRLLQQPVTVSTYLGVTAIGRTFADPITVNAYVAEVTKVELAPETREQISATVLYAAPPDGPLFTEESSVTLPSGRVAQVTRAAPEYNPRTGSLSHYVVDLE